MKSSIFCICLSLISSVSAGNLCTCWYGSYSKHDIKRIFVRHDLYLQRRIEWWTNTLIAYRQQTTEKQKSRFCKEQHLGAYVSVDFECLEQTVKELERVVRHADAIKLPNNYTAVLVASYVLKRQLMTIGESLHIALE